ncbi:MAG TPA: pyridoxal phosphate-dependent aminotransferase [Solirubrobacterales bacterium]|nr:pyridoxal phosphate-dependent aminotransferase [Solirubrobacterales bacterium]
MGERLKGIPGFSIDKVAAAAGSDPEILRMENLDTDIPPPAAAVEATRAAVGTDEANSWLPFTGMGELKYEIARLILRRGGPQYDPESEVVITSGEGDNMLDALLALTDPGDEVIVPDPTYAGMLQRVRLAGDVPRLVPLEPTEHGWRWDLDALEEAVSDRTRAIFFGNPSFPSGWVLSDEEWAAVQRICTERQIRLLYWSAMEAIVFGGTRVVVPAALEGMRDLTVTLGGVACEQRMIGWRIGWIVASATDTPKLGMVHIYNGLVASGFNQLGAIAALRADDHAGWVAEWERRHDATMEQLAGLPAIPAHGGWSLLLDAEAAGTTAPDLSAALLEQKVAATPMTAWGETVAPRHVRFVYSNEPVERLAALGERVGAALS